LLSLTIESKDGGPAVNLGTGLNGGEMNNANDENLRLIAQLPEIERVMMYKGKVTADGLGALAALPKLRYLDMYATEVAAEAFAVLPKLTQLKSLIWAMPDRSRVSKGSATRPPASRLRVS